MTRAYSPGGAEVIVVDREEAIRGEFDNDAFYAALDAVRLSRGLNWKEVAAGAGIAASTLTRLAQGRRPDVNSLAVLVRWGGLDADMYVRPEPADRVHPPIEDLVSHLSADPLLTDSAARALRAMILAAYKELRDSEST